MLTTENLRDYILNDKRDSDYFLRIKLTEEILVHTDDRKDLIQRLLNYRYPGEPQEILRYRLNNISHITRTYFNKILLTLTKIQKSEDFIIKFNNTDFRNYTESYFPRTSSLKNEVFHKLLRIVLTQPNAVCVILPKDESILKNETKKARVNIIEDTQSNLNEVFIGYYNTENVLYIDEYECLLKSDDYYYHIHDNKIDIYYNETKEGSSSRNTRSKLNLINSITYNYIRNPFFQLGGFQYTIESDFIFESFISGVIPFWDQALIEFSDKQSGIKQHLFPTMWRYSSGVCASCNGKGFSIEGLRGSNTRIECSSCKGTGNPPGGMFSEIVLNGTLDPNDPSKTPIPPAGYISKDFTSIEYLDKDYEKMIYSGLASINMEFLMATPLNQSGVAKEMDRSELNSFLFHVASHMVDNIMNKMYLLMAQARYYDFDKEESLTYDRLLTIVPSIRVPQHFDHISGSRIEEKIAKAKSTGLSPYIIASLEKRYIETNFVNFDYERKKLILINKLDPLVGTDTNEKIAIYNANGCTDIDFFVSCNIERIIHDLMDSYSGFFNYSYPKQLELVYERALQIASNDQVFSTENSDTFSLSPNMQDTEDQNSIDTVDTEDTEDDL